MRPSALFGFWGVSTIRSRFLQKTVVARLLVKFRGGTRRVATVDIAAHDGSINLSLPRSGVSEFGWTWDSSGGQFKTIEYDKPQPKTDRITIHASGRVNYHTTLNPGSNYIPCLLDLQDRVSVAAYVVPSVVSLDAAGDLRSGDHIVEVGDDISGRICFEFLAIPSFAPVQPGEVWRFIVESAYGMACVMFPGDQIPLQVGIPEEAFTLVRPGSLLPQQALPEEVAYLRFQQLMHANQVQTALVDAGVPSTEHAKIVDEVVKRGRGIQGPNQNGIWEIVCHVPMRIRPELEVKFEDERYTAELIDMTSIDKRLETVRVRFKVRDQRSGSLVKVPVNILNLFLHAEL